MGAGGGIPIPVSEIYKSSRNYDAKKGHIISTTFESLCDSSITTTDTIQCDFEMVLGFFVDDDLIEERIISHSSSKIVQPLSLSGLDILDKTINFTVP
tara:strand:- start:1501 stop:1794 length:294 start_codon:yes stop_codon:yes gene_type:complete